MQCRPVDDAEPGGSVVSTLWMWLGFNLFVLAILFGVGVFHFLGANAGYEFFTGYLIEKSLSVDNIFVFVLIFSHFAVPAQYQHRVLFWGILGALVMRALLILIGIIHRFHYLKYGLSLVLVLVGAKMLVNAAFDAKIIPTELALISTALLIGGSMLVSVIKTRHLPKEIAAAEAIHGWVPGSPAETDSGKSSSSRPLGTNDETPGNKES